MAATGLTPVYAGFRQFLRKSLVLTSSVNHHNHLIRSAATNFVINGGTEVRRNLTLTSSSYAKQISADEVGDKIVIEGKTVDSDRVNYLAKLPSNNTDCQECPLCKLGLTVRHTDVLIINQFLTSKGKLIPREVTGLCKEQHKRMKYLVVMAEKAGLIERDVERTVTHKGLVYYTPEEWENPHFHKYYDETVIDEFLYGRRKKH